MRFFFGPMSKNIVDTIIEFSLKYPLCEIYFIPSRRQIEYYGGYVNNWTTAEFCKYVKSKNPNIYIERDHGGPGQGLLDDNGYESLTEDCKYMNIIHIDPWKKYQSITDGIKYTIDMINFCYAKNPNLYFEIATEESIRYMTENDLEQLITGLKTQLNSDVFKRIKYLVIQCGTSLLEDSNTGIFDKMRLIKMIDLVGRV